MNDIPKAEFLPFFDYSRLERPVKLGTKGAFLEHRKRISELREAQATASSEATKRARISILASRERASKQAQQYTRLVAIDNSILKERLMEEVYSSEKRIKAELRDARSRAATALNNSVSSDLIEAELKRAHDNVLRRTVTLRTEVQNSMRKIMAQRRLIQFNMIDTLESIRTKMHKNELDILGNRNVFADSVQDARKVVRFARDSMFAGRNQFKANLEHARDSFQSLEKDVKIALLETRGSVENTREDVSHFSHHLAKITEDSRRKTEKNQDRHTRKSDDGNFSSPDELDLDQAILNELRSTKKQVESHREAALLQSRMKRAQMGENFLHSKESFHLEVRFARQAIRDASVRFRIMGTAVMKEFGDRRRKELGQARARRKVQAVRNALHLIRTVR